MINWKSLIHKREKNNMNMPMCVFFFNRSDTPCFGDFVIFRFFFLKFLIVVVFVSIAQVLKLVVNKFSVHSKRNKLIRNENPERSI